MIDLRVSCVSKKYSVRDDSLKNGVRGSRRLRSLWTRRQEFWAVRDVSFELESGETLGIIGHNGAGKSTLLKILSSITAPTSGKIEINGRLSALIEVGSGFHPELTGRENIYLNGSILGMRRREIAKKLDSITDFAGIRQFADMPVKRYSSGMHVRLAFSIAAHLDPDILLLDEVLAVGDAVFQAKCLKRIDDLKKSGTTIIFISHDLRAVERLCDRVLLLQKGTIVAEGAPGNVIAQYERAASDFLPLRQSVSILEGTPRSAEIISVAMCDSEGRETCGFRTGDPIRVRIQYAAYCTIEDAAFDVSIAIDTHIVCQLTTETNGEHLVISPGVGVVEFFCAELGLKPGGYDVDVRMKHRGAYEGIAWGGAILNVSQGKLTAGFFYMPHQWKILEDPSSTDEYANGYIAQEASAGGGRA